nr:hypothetical protein [Fusobacterium necrophorum]
MRKFIKIYFLEAIDNKRLKNKNVRRYLLEIIRVIPKDKTRIINIVGKNQKNTIGLSQGYRIL